jgi:Trypsin-like peptidase domain
MMTTISMPSVQSLLVEMAFGNQPLSTGTAFVCESAKGPVLMTNWHNVSGRNPTTKQPLFAHAGIPDSLRIIHNRGGNLGQWVIKTELLIANGRPRWIEHPTLGDKADLVALPLTDIQGVQLYPYDLVGGPAIAISPAEAISVVGFPFGLQAGGSLAVWATGFVASEPQIDFNGLPIFLIDCRTRPGQSGSAVITHRNGGAVTMQDGSTAIFSGPVTKLQGIYSGRINDQSDIGLVWKVSAIAELIESI